MGAKRQGSTRRERRRARYRPGGPRRRYDPTPVRRSWGDRWDSLLPVSLAVGGVLLLVGGGVNLALISGATGRPKLSVTVERCDTRGSARSRTTDCETRPDDSGTTRTVRDATEEFPAGTVLAVRCGGPDDCAEADAGSYAVGGGMLVFGLGAVAGAVTLRRTRAPGRGLPPR